MYVLFFHDAKVVISVRKTKSTRIFHRSTNRFALCGKTVRNDGRGGEDMKIRVCRNRDTPLETWSISELIALPLIC